MRRSHRISSAAVLTVLTLLTLVLCTPAALAATVQGAGPAVTPAGGARPMALATTGLNITVPVVIGLTSLILGIAVVAWAFLRPSSTRQHR